MELGKIIFNKLSENISEKEEKLFLEWLNSSENNQSIFSNLKKMKENGHDMSNLDILIPNKAWAKVLTKFKAVKKKKPKVLEARTIFKYAAIFIGLIGLSYGSWTFINPNGQNKDNINPNAITLQLSNGNVKEISSAKRETINDVNGNVLSTAENNNTLDYSNVSKAEKLAFNTLSVPYGKTFKVILSDGSTVHLNAGSSIRYPVKFINGKERNVFLSGEAFFDVSKDKENPFIVSSGDMNVRVLGTKFNVSAYKEDKDIKTVLVEGSVHLYNGNYVYDAKIATILEPGHKATWDSTLKEKVNLEKVNTESYISWVDGKLTFRKLLFKDIILKLERHYNVSIKNNLEELDQQRFTATFDTETIVEVLDSFKEDTPFNYKMEGRQIIINKPIETP